MCTYQISVQVDTSDAGDADREKLAAAVSEVAGFAAVYGMDLTAMANAPEPAYYMVASGKNGGNAAQFKLAIGAVEWVRIL